MNAVQEQAKQLSKVLLEKVQQWRTSWEEISRYVHPRLQHSQSTSGGINLTKPDEKMVADLFDTTGVLALQINAGGILAWMTPRAERWFAFSCPPELDEDEEAKAWLNEATDTAYRHITASNLYTALFEMNLCRSSFGTACISRAWDDAKKRLVFASERRFACAESGPDGTADTVLVERTLTAQMAAQMFGLENLPKAVMEIATDAAKRLTSAEYVNLVFPNPDFDPASFFAKERRFRSIWLHTADNHICADGGVDSSPYLVTRYLKWSSDPAAPYGFSPGMQTLPDLKQANRMEQMRDAAVEVRLNPPVMVPHDFKGRVDFRPRGVTTLTAGGGKPELWDYQPDTLEAGASLLEKRQRIQEAYHVPLFAMFQQLDREMTATEVQARLGEKLDNISPTLGLYHDEVLAPLVEWIFLTLLEAGEFGGIDDIPETLQIVDDLGAFVPTPKVDFSNRMSVAIQTAKDAAAVAAVERVGSFLQVQPDLIDEFDLREIVREYFTATGASPKRLRSLSDVQRMRDERAFQQAQMIAAAEAEGQGVSP